jgi:hypothetical protein
MLLLLLLLTVVRVVVVSWCGEPSCFRLKSSHIHGSAQFSVWMTSLLAKGSLHTLESS